MELITNIDGLDDLVKTFARLPAAMQRKAYRRALRAGAKPVKEAAEQNLRQASSPFTGISRKRGAIGIYNLRKFRGNFRVAVQVKRGLVNPAKKGEDGGPVRVGMYLAVLEYGSQKLNRAPRPWIRSALREQSAQAVSAITKDLSIGLQDALAEARGGL